MDESGVVREIFDDLFSIVTGPGFYTVESVKRKRLKPHNAEVQNSINPQSDESAILLISGDPGPSDVGLNKKEESVKRKRLKPHNAEVQNSINPQSDESSILPISSDPGPNKKEDLKPKSQSISKHCTKSSNCVAVNCDDDDDVYILIPSNDEEDNTCKQTFESKTSTKCLSDNFSVSPSNISVLKLNQTPILKGNENEKKLADKSDGIRIHTSSEPDSFRLKQKSRLSLKKINRGTDSKDSRYKTTGKESPVKSLSTKKEEKSNHSGEISPQKKQHLVKEWPVKLKVCENISEKIGFGKNKTVSVDCEKNVVNCENETIVNTEKKTNFQISGNKSPKTSLKKTAVPTWLGETPCTTNKTTAQPCDLIISSRRPKRRDSPKHAKNVKDSNVVKKEGSKSNEISESDTEGYNVSSHGSGHNLDELQIHLPSACPVNRDPDVQSDISTDSRASGYTRATVVTEGESKKTSPVKNKDRSKTQEKLQSTERPSKRKLESKEDATQVLNKRPCRARKATVQYSAPHPSIRYQAKCSKQTSRQARYAGRTEKQGKKTAIKTKKYRNTRRSSDCKVSEKKIFSKSGKTRGKIAPKYPHANSKSPKKSPVTSDDSVLRKQQEILALHSKQALQVEECNIMSALCQLENKAKSFQAHDLDLIIPMRDLEDRTRGQGHMLNSHPGGVWQRLIPEN